MKPSNNYRLPNDPSPQPTDAEIAAAERAGFAAATIVTGRVRPPREMRHPALVRAWHGGYAICVAFGQAELVGAMRYPRNVE